MPDDRAMPLDRWRRLPLAIRGHAADEGRRMVTTVRSHLDAWEGFPQDRQELVGHLRAAHKLGRSFRLESPRR